MKKLYLALTVFITLCFLFISGCNTSHSDAEIKSVFGGERTLNKIEFATDSTSTVRSSFFIYTITGDNSEPRPNEKMVTFQWRMNDGKFQTSSIPFNNVQLKHDNNIETPTVLFHFYQGNNIKTFETWYTEEYISANTQYVLDYGVDYIVLTVKESDWKPVFKDAIKK